MADAKSVWSVFQTSPGRIDPRTGRLVQVTSMRVAPEDEEPKRPPSRLMDEDEEPRAPWTRRRGWRYPQARPEYAGMMSGRMGDRGNDSVLGSLLPWLFVAGVAIIAIEASGITRPKQV